MQLLPYKFTQCEINTGIFIITFTTYYLNPVELSWLNTKGNDITYRLWISGCCGGSILVATSGSVVTFFFNTWKKPKVEKATG